MNQQTQINEIKKKNIQISNILKDIYKDICILSDDLVVFPKKDQEQQPSLPPAGHVNPVTNNTHLYFTNTLRRFW